MNRSPFSSATRAAALPLLVATLGACNAEGDRSDPEPDDRTPIAAASAPGDGSTAMPVDAPPPAGGASDARDGPAPPAADAAPPACADDPAGLSAVHGPDSPRYCYRPADRELSATLPNGTPWWRFALPGEDRTNRIVNLAATRDALVIVAHTVDASGRTGFETSTFEPGGRFLRTVAFGRDGADGRELATIDGAFVILIDGDFLVLVGRYVRPRDGSGGTFAARIDTRDGTTAALAEYGPGTDRAEVRAANGSLALELEEVVHPIDPVTLAAPSLTDGAGAGVATGEVPPLAPIIRESTFEAILRDAVEVANADALTARRAEWRELARTLSEALPTGRLAETGLGLTAVTAPEDGSVRDYEVSCDAGGTLAVRVTLSVPVYDLAARDCWIGDALHDGSFTFNGVGPEGSGSAFEAVTVRYADGTGYALDGEYDTRFDRIGFAQKRLLSGIDHVERSVDGVRSMTNADAVNETRDGRRGRLRLLEDGTTLVDVNEYSASFDARFTLSAPSTGNVPVSVVADLAFEGDHYGLASRGRSDYPLSTLSRPVMRVALSEDGGLVPLALFMRPTTAQWSTGVVRIEAPDGSALELAPISEDPVRATIALAPARGAPFVREWADGLQWRCFGNREAFAGCR